MAGCECCPNGNYETECLSCHRKICNDCWGLCNMTGCGIKTCETCKEDYGKKHYRCVIHQYDPKV